MEMPKDKNQSNKNMSMEPPMDKDLMMAGQTMMGEDGRMMCKGGEMGKEMMKEGIMGGKEMMKEQGMMGSSKDMPQESMKTGKGAMAGKSMMEGSKNMPEKKGSM